MRSPRWLVTTLAAAITIGATVAAVVPAAVAAPTGRRCSAGAQPAGKQSFLDGVAVVSLCDVWAVGSAGSPAARTLIEHWNGTHWTEVASPSPAGDNDQLTGVAAVSSSNIWAAGYFANGAFNRTLIEHWNGHRWRVVTSPDPGGTSASSVLNGIWAASASNIWAVGYVQLHGIAHALIEHWNGKAWTAITKPNQAATTNGTYLNAVSGSSNSQVWAVGNFCPSQRCVPVFYRLRGNKWQSVASPALPGTDIGFVLGVSVVSSTDAWAVGSLAVPSAEPALIEHWDGHAWRRIKVVPPAGSDESLNGVIAAPGRVVAVGGAERHGKASTLILSWNGKTWTRARSRDPLGSQLSYELAAIAGSSCSTGWLVGEGFSAQAQFPVALHC